MCSKNYSPVGVRPELRFSRLEDLDSNPTISFILPASPWALSKSMVGVCVCEITDKIPTGGNKDFAVVPMQRHISLFMSLYLFRMKPWFRFRF